MEIEYPTGLLIRERCKTMITRDKNGNVINSGDTIVSFRGNPWTFIRASRANSSGRSGKVIVVNDDGNISEFYDMVFDLTVTED